MTSKGQARPALPAEETPALPEEEAPAPERTGWSSGLELRHLRALLALVDHGSLTAAAQALGMAQSTMSETMAALDRTLGTPAVARRRGARGNLLTPAGRALLPHARRVLTAVEDAQAAVAAVTREARASVDIVANESVSSYLLPDALALLRDRWPGTRFAVTVGACQAVRDGVARGRFDVGLLLATEAEETGPAAAGETGTLLAEVTLVLFGGGGHPLARAAAVPRARLAPYRIFASDASGDFHAMLRGFFQADGVPAPRLEASGTIDAVKRSVLAEPLALGVLPDYALADDLRAGLARVVPVRPSLPRLRLEAHLGETRPLAPAAADLVQVVRAAAGRPQNGHLAPAPALG
ncbi:MAG TPA: LysR family transcriptional regulator [Thermoanaerobaculia bacterium]